MEGKQNAKAKSQCSQELGLLMCETLRWRNLNKASLWSWWVKKKGKALHHPCAWIESCWPSRRGSLSWGTFWWIQPRPLRFWLTIKICNILGTWSVCPLSCLFGHFFFSHLFALYYRLDKQNGRANILLHQAALAGPDEADLLPCNFFLSMEFCCGYTHEHLFSVCWVLVGEPLTAVLGRGTILRTCRVRTVACIMMSSCTYPSAHCASRSFSVFMMHW